MSIYAGLRKRIEKMLAPADVAINGPRPWDIRVRDSRLYGRVFTEGSLGFGEAYMDGWWDSESLDQLIYRLIRAGVKERVNSLVVFAAAVKARIINCQSLRRAFAVGEKHYNIGNELFEQMLDSRMIYSCGYWKRARTLDQAQADKLDLVCRKLHLREGQKVLDIGCGWGGTARYMAENYGVAVVGVTVSTAQAEYARQNCRDLPVEIRVEDYRDVQGSFDRIVSIGMFEHVGYKNYRTYFRKVAELLKENGIFLLHTIGGNTPSQRVDPWFDRYIFPNGMIPSTRQVCAGYEGLFVLEDWHNFGLDYDKTLMAWHDNFTRAWANLQNHYDERFRRMWTYYLLSCAGSFRARDNQVWQVALSRQGLPEGYSFPR